MRSSTVQSRSPYQGHHPPQDSGVSVEEFIAGCRSRDGRLPFEIGAFLALETCEALQERGPGVVSSEHVNIGFDGFVSLAPLRPSSDQDAANSVLSLLAHLLVASGTGVPAVLLHLVEFGPTTGQWRLASLRDELEASLLPLNRGAARRVLGRMLRETRSRKTSSPMPRADVVDADLDALLLGRDTPLEAQVVSRTEPVPFSEVIAQSARRPTRGGTAKRREPSHVERPKTRRRPLGSDLDDSPRQRPRFGRWGLAAAVGLGGLAFVLAGGLERQLDTTSVPTTSALASVPTTTPGEELGDLFVQAGEGAQILLFVGRGPATASQLPIGVAQEFVVIADGHAPSRALVPADAQWTGHGRSRFELSVQPNPIEMAFEELRLGPTSLSRAAMGEPSGRLGDVVVHTEPEGARVFLVIGFGSANMENLRTNQPHELLIIEDGSAPERVFVGPSDWSPRAGGLTPLAHIRL